MATPKKQSNADIAHHPGTQILLPGTPRPMTIRTTIDILQRAEAEQNQEITVIDVFKGTFPWDGAMALQKALTNVFGFAFAVDEGCCEKPKMVPVAISETETVLVPWGTFTIPGIPTARLSCGVDENKHFQLSASLYRRDKPALDTLLAEIRRVLLTDSLYRGKIVQFAQGMKSFGEKVALPEITFITPSPTPPIFSDYIERAIDALILTPIRHRASVKRAGTPIKRGVLLAGRYGTGKTLLAGKIANVAKAEGWTVVYVAHPDQLVPALNFAKLFQPVVVFVEDIDRVIGQERTDEVNEMINEIDGVGTKDNEILLVMTTNHPETINKALLRNGRVDVRLLIREPNAGAVERLIRHYAGVSLDKTASISVPAHRLAGQIPATIREAVERAKLFALTRTFGNSARINGNDLLGATEMLLAENELFTKEPEPVTRLELIGRGIGGALADIIKSYERYTRNEDNASEVLELKHDATPDDLTPVVDHEASLTEQTTR